MEYKLNYKLYSILNGYFTITVNNTKYKVIYPSLEVKYKAEELYVDIIESGKFETEYMNNSQVDAILAYYKIWTQEEQERLQFLEKTIEQLKMKLYEEYSSTDRRIENKSQIEDAKKMIAELSIKKHSLDYLKLEHFATSTKNQYIISQRILNQDGTNVFTDNYEDLDTPTLSKFLKSIEEKTVTSQDLREIVKGDIWSSYAVQDRIFGPSVELNDDQRNLLALHRMYSNVRQHPECPSDEIINDDDALDGWFLFQKDKRKKEKTKNKVLNRVRGKIKDHSDIFIFTQDQEERKAIWDMNDAQGKIQIKAIEKAYKDSNGERIEWQEIPIIRQQLIDEKIKGSKI